jgi:UDP-2,4-diacetamido-2,4,6-trideoxy-beta-L-altropyranose hydrolase
MDAPIKVAESMSTSKAPTIKSLNFVFRLDAGKKVGNGHFMRCLVLSTELIKRGHLVAALIREIPSHLQALLTGLGITTYSISLNSDGLSELSNINEKKRIDWLVIDHYGIETQWESEARRFASRIMVIDDLANRQHNCDLLLDQNIPNHLQKGYTDLVPKGCVIALGWTYLLARPSFYLRCEMPRSGTLVFLGGGDHSQALSSLLDQLLSKTEYHPLRVLVSSDYLPLAHWQNMVGARGQVHCDLVNPVSLYLSAALAVVRCGFVSYELALLGIPAIQIHSSAVQAEVALELEHYSMGVALKDSQLPSSELLQTALQKASSMIVKPLNEKLSPGALPVAELLERIHEHQ